MNIRGINVKSGNLDKRWSIDLEKRIQSEDRAHRIGQKNKVLYIDLVAKGTVDEKIIQALRNKVNIAKEISGEELSKWI